MNPTQQIQANLQALKKSQKVVGHNRHTFSFYHTF